MKIPILQSLFAKKINYSKQIKFSLSLHYYHCVSKWATPLTFRRERVTFTCILIGWGQHVLLSRVLLAGRWRARRRQHKQVDISVVRSDVLLVLSGALSVSVPPLLAVL